MKPTVNDPMKRTVNRAAEAMSTQDVYRHNPWRAPGTAAVVDACGMAGGSPHSGPEWANYTTTKYAKQGDKGSAVLPEVPSATVWKRGQYAEATWQVTANHGGGYQYRLCPAGSALTEECFQKMPLQFGNKQFLVWNDGTRKQIEPVYVKEGTTPKGSTWVLNPIPPRCLSGECREGKKCAPLPEGEAGTPCDDTPEPSFDPPCDETGNQGRCSGNQPSKGGTTVAVVDWLEIPKNIEPGKYVLGWRWDCEATAQVWSACSD